MRESTHKSAKLPSSRGGGTAQRAVGVVRMPALIKNAFLRNASNPDHPAHAGSRWLPGACTPPREEGNFARFNSFAQPEEAT
jgi:hypothetical protein